MEEIVSLDHDYVSSIINLNPYIENIIEYIAGYAVAKMIKSNICQICSQQLTETAVTSKLIELKTQGKLLQPSADVVKICLVAERSIREGNVFQKNFLAETCVNVMGAVAPYVFNSIEMEHHMVKQDIDSHKIQLIKFVTERYVKIRLYHIGKTSSEKTANIRSKYTKLVLFHNQ